MPFLTGCQTFQAIATSAPAAVAPQISAPGSRAVPFSCGSSTSSCFISTSHADAGSTNALYQFSLVATYNVLNAFSVLEDGVPVPATDSHAPPANQTSYFKTDNAPPANGHGALAVTVYPKRAPDSKAHGTVSTIRFMERSSNPQYHGTPQETAFTDLQLTYVDPDRCQIIDLAAPSEVTKGDNIPVSWSVTNCKTFQLFRMVGAASGSVVGGSQPTPPDVSMTSSLLEENFSNTRTFQSTLAGTETYRAVAKNALGMSVSRLFVTRVKNPASSGNGGSSSSPCTARGFTMCVSCPGSFGAGPNESELPVQACTSDDAKSSAELGNPGCAVSAGGFQSFTFSVSCPNGDKTLESVMACTDAGGNQSAGRRHSSDCTVRTGVCP
jgi:hypothetical protein